MTNRVQNPAALREKYFRFSEGKRRANKEMCTNVCNYFHFGEQVVLVDNSIHLR